MCVKPMAQGPNVAQHLMSCEPPEYIMFMVVMFIMKDQHVLFLVRWKRSGQILDTRHRKDENTALNWP